MAMPAWRALLALALAAQSAAIRGQVAHPVGHHRPFSSGEPTGFQQMKKVVRPLQDMEEKITKEGDALEVQFEKYKSYCKSYGKELAKRIRADEDKIPGIEPRIKAAKMEKARTDKDVQKSQAEHAEAKANAEKTTAKREREAVALAEEKREYETNIAAIKDGVHALKSGSYGSFLQTGAAATLRKTLSAGFQLPDDAAMDFPELAFFLTGRQQQGADHAQGRVETIAVLEQLAKEMTKSLNQIVDTDAKAAQAYEAAMAAKQKEIASHEEAIELKLGRSADLGVSIVSMENYINDTQAALLEDKRFAEQLNATCANKTSEWEESTKLRHEELTAIAETIKMLSNDSALEAFSTTLPSATGGSFMRLAGSDGAKARALEILRRVSKKDHALFALRMGFIGLALRGNRVGLNKVIKMIDDMANIIEEEKLADETKMEYCDKRLNAVEGKTKELDWQPGNIQKAMADTEEGLKLVTEMIAGRTQSIAELDRAVAGATEQRKQDRDLYLKLIDGNTAAKQLLDLAKKRLLQFYTPQPQTTNTTAFARAGPLSIAFEGTVMAQLATVTKHRQALELSKAQPPPPEGPAAYSKKAVEARGVIDSIGLLVQDLDTEITQAEKNDESDQESYDALMTDSVNHRDHDTRILIGEMAVKANLVAELERHRSNQTANFNGTQILLEVQKDNLSAILNDFKATSQFLAQSQAACVWFHKYYGTRNAGRKSETDALAKAKAVLSGVNPTLLQASKGKRHRHRRPRAVQQAMLAM